MNMSQNKKDSVMDINTNYSQSNDIMSSEVKSQQAEALYQIKLMKMQQEADTAVASTLLEDTAEISQEAMDKYLSELNV